MLEWLIVISLILFGLGLIIVEVIFVPGTTIVGIGGFLFAAFGVYQSFEYFGRPTGMTVMGVSVFVTVVAFMVSIRSGVWRRFALKKSIDSKVNEGLSSHLSVGDAGITVSALRPIGKAEIKEKVYEVTTIGNYLKTGEKIRIIRINLNKIYVEPITNK